MKTIKSPSNPIIKNVLRLKKAQEREQSGQIIIEGYQEIGLAVRSGVVIDKLFFSQKHSNQKNSPDTIPSLETIELSAEAFERIAYRKHPDGFLAVGKAQKKALSDIKLLNNPLVLVLEGIEKPGNLGAIMRTADAVGVDVIILANPSTDLYNPNVIRASLGTVFTNLVVTTTAEKAIEWLQDNKINIIITSPKARTEYYDIDLTKNIALVIGSEHAGLTDGWFQASNEQLRLPMKGKIDSLNASVSAAVVLYEIIRQRRVSG
jgi:TrmH family RNA methyltransferase